MNQRLTKLMDWLKEENIEAAFLTSTENVFYLSGFRTDPHERLLGVMVFQEKEPFLVCPGMETEDVRNAGWEFDIVGYSDTDNPWEFISKQANKRVNSIEQLAVEKTHLIVERYESLQETFLPKQFRAVEEIMHELRMIKDEEELEILREAAKFADFAIEVGVNEIEEGKTEQEIIAKIEYELKKKGISEMSFSTMVLTGKNAASPHGNPGDTKIQKGDLVLFDLGVVYKGYCSDITRTVAYGEINDEQKKIYDTVLQAQLASLEKVKPGVTAKELDQTARDHIAQAGYGDYFPHRLGHGLGVSVHEYPSITETNDLVMKAGMAFTIEPGVYVPNVAGVRIEDDIYITENGPELLTKFPKELQMIK
ncbi:M24 family metallopeptidase [Rossellomorea sp. BNER]|uniref:M24 family metallopeptidase n=1 Tax=Rossellomorea sp. BNER TaxID=2962031 RepID=UPI003AF2D1FF|nr:Xaa-Pro peptidase family protein [Rossellomorea sp. BNER]